MSWGLSFAKRDDPVSEKAFGCYTKFYGLIAGAFLVVIVSVFFVQQLNLLLGVEKEVTITLTDVKQIDKKGTRKLLLLTDDGHEFSQKMRKYTYKDLKTKKGEKIEAKIDGLFWSRVVAVKTEKGYKTIY